MGVYSVGRKRGRRWWGQGKKKEKKKMDWLQKTNGLTLDQNCSALRARGIRGYYKSRDRGCQSCHLSKQPWVIAQKQLLLWSFSVLKLTARYLEHKCCVRVEHWLKTNSNRFDIKSTVIFINRCRCSFKHKLLVSELSSQAVCLGNEWETKWPKWLVGVKKKKI